jgi:hypothetical protein
VFLSHLDPSVRGMDLDPDPDLEPFITMQKKIFKNLDSYCFVTFFDFLSLQMYLQKVISKKP